MQATTDNGYCVEIHTAMDVMLLQDYNHSSVVIWRGNNQVKYFRIYENNGMGQKKFLAEMKV